MFNFMDMAGNYEDRKVDRHDGENFFISTARVTDGQKDYETAVAHPNYNDGKIVIVEMYDTKEEAQTGHDKWVGFMSSDSLPLKLIDCSNSGVSQLLEMFGGDTEFWEED